MAVMEDNKQKALSAALSQIERQFGKGTVMRLGDQPVGGAEDAISTGSLGLRYCIRNWRVAKRQNRRNLWP